MAEFAVEITYNALSSDENGNYSSQERKLILTTVEDTNISASNTLTDHPIVTGAMASDHAYKNPNVVTLRGSVMRTRNGSHGLTVNSNTELSLSDLEKLLMEIKDEAYLCDIVKIGVVDDDIKFSEWSSMALQSISLIEKINTLEYVLTFRQVITVSVKYDDISPEDSFLPDITEPETTNFTESLIDWDMVIRSLNAVLKDTKLMQARFEEYLQSLSTTAVVSIIGGLGAIATLTTIVAGAGKVLATQQAAGLIASKLLATVAAINPLVAAANVAAVIFIVGTIALVKKIKQKMQYRINAFTYSLSDKKNRKEAERYFKLQTDVVESIAPLNDKVTVYNLTLDAAQEAIVLINDSYYSFTFTRNNVGETYSCSITTFDSMNSQVGSIDDVFSAPSSYLDLTADNALLILEDADKYVHLINSGSDKNLTNIKIVVSNFNPKNFSTQLYNTILDSLTK